MEAFPSIDEFSLPQLIVKETSDRRQSRALPQLPSEVLSVVNGFLQQQHEVERIKGEATNQKMREAEWAPLEEKTAGRRRWPGPLGGRLLLVGSYFSPAAFEVAQAADVWLLDSAGNHLITLPGFICERSGLQIPNRASPKSGALFVGKEGLIIRALLAGGVRPWAQLDLAKAAGVSTGLCSRVITQLLALGLCSRHDKRLWVSAPDKLVAAFSDHWFMHCRPLVAFSPMNSVRDSLDAVAAFAKRNKMAMVCTVLDEAVFGEAIVVHVSGRVSASDIQELRLQPDTSGSFFFGEGADEGVFSGIKAKRFTGVSGWLNFTSEIQSCLDAGAINPKEVGGVVVRLERLALAEAGKR